MKLSTYYRLKAFLDTAVLVMIPLIILIWLIYILKLSLSWVFR